MPSRRSVSSKRRVTTRSAKNHGRALQDGFTSQRRNILEHIQNTRSPDQFHIINLHHQPCTICFTLPGPPSHRQEREPVLRARLEAAEAEALEVWIGVRKPSIPRHSMYDIFIPGRFQRDVVSYVFFSASPENMQLKF